MNSQDETFIPCLQQDINISASPGTISLTHLSAIVSAPLLRHSQQQRTMESLHSYADGIVLSVRLVSITTLHLPRVCLVSSGSTEVKLGEVSGE